MPKWALEALQKHGPLAAITAVLLWFLLTTLGGKLDAHSRETSELIKLNRVICLNTAKMAGHDPTRCL